MDEATIQGAEIQTEAQTGGDDAALLSAYLTQEEESKRPVEETAADPASQAETKTEAVDQFTVKVNGEEKLVSREELIAHYQKEAASSQRFEEAAALRREAEAQKAQYIQHQQMLQNALNHFQQQAQLFQVPPPDARLLNDNPHEYLIQKEQYEQFQQRLQQAQTAQAYLQQQQTVEQQQYEAQRLAEEEKRLLDVLPEWKDQKVLERDQKELLSYLKGLGYNDQDIQGLNRSRASNIRIAVNAMRYEKLLAQAKSSAKRVENLPARTERPGVASVQSNNAFQEAKNRLSKTGSIDDATAAFAAMFG